MPLFRDGEMFLGLFKDLGSFGLLFLSLNHASASNIEVKAGREEGQKEEGC